MDIHTHRMFEDENETTPIDTNVDGEAGAVNVYNEVEEIQNPSHHEHHADFSNPTMQQPGLVVQKLASLTQD